VQYGAHKMKFKSYIGLDVNKVCGINKYQKPGGFAAAGRADRLRPGLSAKSVVWSSKHADSSRFTLSATFSMIAKSIYSQPLFNSMDL